MLPNFVVNSISSASSSSSLNEIKDTCRNFVIAAVKQNTIQFHLVKFAQFIIYKFGDAALFA